MYHDTFTELSHIFGSFRAPVVINFICIENNENSSFKMLVLNYRGWVNQFSFLQFLYYLFIKCVQLKAGGLSVNLSQHFTPQAFACSDKDHFRASDLPAVILSFKQKYSCVMCHVSI